ncbi:MAG: hypothetical protein QM775_20330 [Pirellulales bacterium]
MLAEVFFRRIDRYDGHARRQLTGSRGLLIDDFRPGFRRIIARRQAFGDTSLGRFDGATAFDDKQVRVGGHRRIAGLLQRVRFQKRTIGNDAQPA